MSLDHALWATLHFEGGKADAPLDHGGRTDHGVTQATYDRWRVHQGFSPGKDVWTITKDEVLDIYAEGYWDTTDCDALDALDERLSLIVFDAAVHHSPMASVRFLQQALGAGLSADGIFGPQTLHQVQHAWATGAAEDVLEKCLDQRQQKMDNIVRNDPRQEVFARGWRNRVNTLRQLVLTPDPLTVTLAKVVGPDPLAHFT